MNVRRTFKARLQGASHVTRGRLDLPSRSIKKKFRLDIPERFLYIHFETDVGNPV